MDGQGGGIHFCGNAGFVAEVGEIGGKAVAQVERGGREARR